MLGFISCNHSYSFPSSAAASKKTTSVTGNSLKATNTLESSSVPLEKSVEDLALELDILKGQLTQYCYVNNLSEKTLYEQQRDAEVTYFLIVMML